MRFQMSNRISRFNEKVVNYPALSFSQEKHTCKLEYSTKEDKCNCYYIFCICITHTEVVKNEFNCINPIKGCRGEEPDIAILNWL